MAHNFNSTEFIGTLLEGGFSDKQATTLTLALVQLMDSHLVTKSYLDMKLTELRAEFRAELAQLKSELIQWMFTILIVQTGATALLFKFLH